MLRMKYICPKRCVVNDKGGLCTQCGRNMITFGRVDEQGAMEKITEEQLSRKGRYNKPSFNSI